jgi:hypothetical protein
MIIDRIPTDELRRLLDDFGTQIATLRVGAVQYTTSIVEHAMSSDHGSVEVVIGKVEQVDPVGPDRLAVTVAGPGDQARHHGRPGGVQLRPGGRLHPGRLATLEEPPGQRPGHAPSAHRAGHRDRRPGHTADAPTASRSSRSPPSV